MSEQDEQYGRSPALDALPLVNLSNKLTALHINYESAWKDMADLMGYDYRRKSTRWTRFKWRIQEFGERIHDAWEVLKGNRID